MSLTVEEPTSPPTSTKRAQDVGQKSPRDVAYSKWTHVVEGDASGEGTPTIKIPDIFSSRVLHTL